MKLWIGQTVSMFGSETTTLALPLTAVLLLRASAFQMGILTASTTLPFLLFSLFAGVWIDRWRRRPILIIADTGRALLLLSIPLLSLGGFLRIEYLYIVSFAVGTLTVLFEVAYYSFLPSLVPREQLIEGNSKLEASSSSAQIAGPGIAGELIQVVQPPMVLFLDACSFLFSAVSLVLIRAPEQAPAPAEQRKGVWRAMGEGLRFVGKNPTLRSLVGCGATHNLASSILTTVLLLYMTRNLAIQPASIGVIFALGSCASLAGAFCGGRLSSKFQVGPTILWAQLLTGVGSLFYVIAGGAPIMIIICLITGKMIWGLSRPIFNIGQVSLRQTITPDHLLGRMNASFRFITWGIMPIGGFIGGLLGEIIGLRLTLGIVALLELLAVLWIGIPPSRSIPHHAADDLTAG